MHTLRRHQKNSAMKSMGPTPLKNTMCQHAAKSCKIRRGINVQTSPPISTIQLTSQPPVRRRNRQNKHLLSTKASLDSAKVSRQRSIRMRVKDIDMLCWRPYTKAQEPVETKGVPRMPIMSKRRIDSLMSKPSQGESVSRIVRPRARPPMTKCATGWAKVQQSLAENVIPG